MSVVGLDIGNENCVIGVAKQRGIDVLLNDESKRETPAVVSFGEKQRFMGSAGAASATMLPKSTISQIKRLIAKKFNDPTVQNDLRLFPFKVSESTDGGILIHVQYLNGEQTFSPVQILAMLFAHLKQIAEKNLENANISDCVIGVPSYFTDLQRRAYLHAAEIAGLNPLSLIHDCTATALGYGIYKTDFLQRGPSNVVFVDIGHSDTQVAVVSFARGQMKVLSHAFDANLGGRDFDEVLFSHFASQFKEQYNIDVYSNARASIRLRSSCEKLKKVLSANPEAPLNIECLMEEKDVKGYIKRDDFEKLSSELLERISIPCRKAVLDSGLSLDKIHTVELVGSGSRIPVITKILNSVLGKEPRRTVNASECVARGCSILCAMLSPTFKVRDYEVQDCFPFSIGFALQEGPIRTMADGVLFPKGKPFPSKKILTLHRNDIFEMEAFYSNQKELPSGVSPGISSFKIGPFRISHVEKAKIKLRVQLNLNGIVTIDSACLIEERLDDSTSNNNSDSLTEYVEQNNHESSGKANGSSGHEMRRQKATRRQDVFIEENIYGGMSSHELSQAKKTELQLSQQDIKMERTKDKKNSLEAYVYETRNKLLNTYRSFATDLEKEGISSNLQQTEEWLYEDGDDESESVYSQKFEDLKKTVDPIENRYKDEEARAVAARSLWNCIIEYREAVKSLPPNERDEVFGECIKAEQWLREKTAQQDALPKTADPVLWASEIQNKIEFLDEICNHVIASHDEARDLDTRGRRDDMDSDTRGRRDDMDVD